ncbi:S-layer homology domain-containing protein [Paenibacillus xylanivorans]|uniref:S-layer homology domain-containing protein n=1 Tax=Paenibacillus xylanivorans TaxID=1705561 RepID=UPI0006B1B981|nr:S-layer homology domain-containing protein [Paenibacillus xylanivorans]
MRNTSDPIKENSNVMNTQGGEKKVMKKILSVALSTAMAFSMFASVAFGDTAVSPQQQFDALKAKGIFSGYPDGTAGLDKDMTRAEFAKVITKLLGLKEITGTLSYTDKNYTAKNWAVPYIEAVTAAGIMEGKNVEKKIFDFNGKVTVSEMATILTRALDLEIPAETNNSAADWAKGYVQAAINAGLIDSKANFGANASRELLVGAAYAIDQAQSLKVTKYEVSEGGKVVTFTISDGETVKVTLEKALEANKETEVKFTYKDKSFTEKVTYVVEAATKVQSASSTNLKEVDVAFDGKVDKATGTDKNNYTVDNNSRKVKSVTLLEDGKTARLLLDTTSAGTFTQGTTYKVVVKNVKSSTGTVLPQGEVSFTSADNTLPTVTEVKALGTKAIKVTFSEPIKTPTSSNFQLDDKAFVGSVTLGANEREVILRDYTGTISAGAHKLTTSLVEDYAGLKSLAATSDFTAAVDTEGPKVTEISATLEKVTVTFDEEVDPNSVTNESFYWLSGTTKKTGKATQISGNVYEVDFTANRLPGYETNLFVDVKDYSGNANATKEHKVTATVDLVQPKVVDVTYGSDVTDELTVRFDKAVNAGDIKYFTVKKGNDVIPVKSVYAKPGYDNKVFNVTFYSKLSGSYSLKVADVKDFTALNNTLVTYEGTFLASDSAAPKLADFGGVDVNRSERKVALTFDREIDLATLNNRANYYVKFVKSGSSVAQNISLPTDVQVNVANDGKSVVLVFPQYIEGTLVSFPGSVQEVSIAGLKSKTGQATSWIESGTLNETVMATPTAEQKDARTIELTFNKAIAQASVNDFTVSGNNTVNSVSIDNNKVTLKTSADLANSTNVNILNNNSIQTYAGHKIAGVQLTTTGSVAPRVKLNSGDTLSQNDRVIVLPFTVALDNTVDATGVAANLLVKRADKASDSDALVPVTDYTAKVVGSTVEITIKDTYSNPSNIEYIVSVKDNATFIRTTDGKFAAKSDAFRTSTNVTSPTGVTTSAVSTVREGAVQDNGAKQVAELTLTGTPTVDEDVIVVFNDGAAKSVTHTVVAGDTLTTIATAVAGDFNTALTANYVVTSNGAKVVFTAKNEANSKPIGATVSGAALSGSARTTSEGKAPVAAAAQQVKITVTQKANRDGSNTVKFTDGTITKEVKVDVLASESTSDIALNIKNAFAGELTGYTVTNSASDVIFTADNAAANKTITITTSAN